MIEDDARCSTGRWTGSREFVSEKTCFEMGGSETHPYCLEELELK